MRCAAGVSDRHTAVYHSTRRERYKQALVFVPQRNGCRTTAKKPSYSKASLLHGWAGRAENMTNQINVTLKLLWQECQDRCKTSDSIPMKYRNYRQDLGGEIILIAAYEALGSHCQTAVMPAGIRKPKQIAPVEGTAGKIDRP